MKKTIIFIGLVAILIVGGIFVLKKYRTPTVSMNKVELEAENDRKVLIGFLSGVATDERLVYAAVIRLGQVGDPDAFNVAQKLVDSSSTYLREGAAQALGYYEDAKVIDALSKLVADSAESVRAFAIEALAVQPSAMKIGKLKEIDRNHANLSNAEKVEVKAALFKSYPDKTPEKSSALKELVAYSQTKDNDLFVKSSTKAIQIAGNEEPVKALMKSIVANPAEVNTKALSIRVLGNLNDSFLNENYKTLLSDKNSAIRLAALQTFHRACPPERWNLLAQLASSEKDPQIIQVMMQELSFLERAKAIEFVEKWSQLAGSSEMKTKLNEFKPTLPGLPEVESCKKN